jgi:hypothetical protein
MEPVTPADLRLELARATVRKFSADVADAIHAYLQRQRKAGWSERQAKEGFVRRTGWVDHPTGPGNPLANALRRLDIFLEEQYEPNLLVLAHLAAAAETALDSHLTPCRDRQTPQRLQRLEKPRRRTGKRYSEEYYRRYDERYHS